MRQTPRPVLLGKFIAALPAVKRELSRWKSLAQTIPEPLRTQALLSIEHKAFHCLGGSVYAQYPGVHGQTMLSFVVALQTISDYLDNLCDRLGVCDPSAFQLLHKSFRHALNPYAPLNDYYALYPYREETYLSSLVQQCQKTLQVIPYYHLNYPYIERLAEYYCELQVLKHSPRGEELLRSWAASIKSPQELTWNEWTAACGSTLGIFMFTALSFQPPQDQDDTFHAYFPWIQGLHILLDYLIDLEEDNQNGDLNFLTFYPSEETRNRSLISIAQKSKERAIQLVPPSFHQTIVDGLIALYGSDPKVHRQGQTSLIRHIAASGGSVPLLTACDVLRRTGLI